MSSHHIVLARARPMPPRFLPLPWPVGSRRPRSKVVSAVRAIGAERELWRQHYADHEAKPTTRCCCLVPWMTRPLNPEVFRSALDGRLAALGRPDIVAKLIHRSAREPAPSERMAR